MDNNSNDLYNKPKKIVTNEFYDDYQIISPKNFEEIAKAYQLAIKQKKIDIDFDMVNKNLFDSSIDSNHLLENQNETNLKFEELKQIIIQLYNNVNSLKYLCSKRFYYRKEIEVKSIISVLDEILENFFDPTFSNKIDNIKKSKNISYNNYCAIISDSLRLISTALTTTFTLFVKSSQKTLLFKIHDILSSIIPNFSNLIGECKYRYLN